MLDRGRIVEQGSHDAPSASHYAVQVFVIGVVTEAGAAVDHPSATFSIVRIEERDA